MAIHSRLILTAVISAAFGLSIAPPLSASAEPMHGDCIIIAEAAAADTGKSKDAPATAANTDSSAEQVAGLKQEQQQLRRMGEAVKRTNRAGMDLIIECTQPVEMVGEIDIIGQDIIPIMPITAEGFGTHYIPPRPKYMKLHMAQLGAMIPILQDDIDSLLIPSCEKDFAAQPLADVKGYMGDLQKHFQKLQDLTKTEDYDQISITNEARGVDACCKGIDSARKKLLHLDVKTERTEEKLERDEEKKDKH